MIIGGTGAGIISVALGEASVSCGGTERRQMRRGCQRFVTRAGSSRLGAARRPSLMGVLTGSGGSRSPTGSRPPSPEHTLTLGPKIGC